MDSMFDILTELPLFRGVTRERMAETVGMARFHFLKYQAGDTIVSAGEPCTHIRFIISGKVRICITNSDDRFRICQTLKAPDAISPDFLFGASTVYPGSVVALEPVSLVQLSKNDYVKVLNSDNIFLYNFINYLSMNAQKCVDGVLALSSGSIEERVAMWVIAMTQPTATDITLSCRQRDLYSIFGVQRSSFIAALDNLRDRGIINYRQGEIQVLDRRALLNIIRHGLE